MSHSPEDVDKSKAGNKALNIRLTWVPLLKGTLRHPPSPPPQETDPFHFYS